MYKRQVLEYGGKLYAVWSGWEGTTNVSQRIYIAEMSDPLTITGERAELSRPEYSWELDGTPTINEGAQIAVSPEGVVNIIYSASGSWTDNYCLGRLTLRGENPMNPEDWEKGTESVFHKSAPSTYSTGHALSLIHIYTGRCFQFGSTGLLREVNGDV